MYWRVITAWSKADINFKTPANALLMTFATKKEADNCSDALKSNGFAGEGFIFPKWVKVLQRYD